MIKNKLIILCAMIALVGGGYYMQTAHGSDSESSGQKEAENKAGEKANAAQTDSAEISKEAADAAGIRTETVRNEAIHETITLTGRITLNQNTTAQVKARFPGIVREVKKGQGESARIGDVLALVESNESLQVYPVKAPINGVILSRNTNAGDVAGEQPIFIIANTSDVWVEFHIFPRDIDQVKTGQMVQVTSFEGQHTGKAPISVVSPIAESSSQTIVARVTLPNPDGLWHSGMTVRGDVAVSEKEVPLAVRTQAIQRMENNSVVFAQKGGRYVMRPIKTGISDSQWTEVLDGLQAGETYVTENSFLIKADIGKAGAKEED